jgi:hypothetical protein
MSAFDRADARMFAEELALQLRGPNVTPTGGGLGGGAGQQDNFGMLSRGVNNFVGIVGQLSQGTFNLTSAVGTVAQVLGIFGPVGQAFGQFGQGVSQYVLDIHSQMQASNSYGANFNNNMGLYTEAVSSAGISQQDFNRWLQEGSKSVGGLASTANQSNLIYLSIAKEMRENQDVFQAKLAGITTEDFNSALGASANLMRNLDMREDANRKILMDSAVGAAVEIDNMSRITGRSRQEIQKGIDTQVNSTQMQIAKMSMDEEELAAYNRSLPLIEGFGAKVTDVFTEMSSNQGNIVSPEGSKTMGALNALAPNLANLLQALSTETDPARQQELQTSIMEEYALMRSNKDAMKRWNALAKSGNENAREVIAILSQGEKVGTSLSKMMKENADPTQFRATLEGYKAEFGKLRTDAGTGKGIEGEAALPAETISALNEQIKSISAGVGVGMNELNTTVGKGLVPEMKLLNELFKMRTAQEMRMLPEELEKKIKEKIGYSGVNLEDKTNAPNDPRYKRVTGSGPDLKDNSLKVDKWFEDFGSGTMMQLDGLESVIRKQDIPAFVRDQVSANPGLLQGLQGSLKNAAYEAKSAMPTQFQSLIDNFKSMNVPATVSSATPPSIQTPDFGAETRTTSDVVTAIEKLNTKMDRLINSVEDGTYKNVRAVKGQGNAIA